MPHETSRDDIRNLPLPDLSLQPQSDFEEAREDPAEDRSVLRRTGVTTRPGAWERLPASTVLAKSRMNQTGPSLRRAPGSPCGGFGDPAAVRAVSISDRGSTYTANSFTKLCRDLGIRQSMGRVGSCFDNAAAEAFFSSLEWEVPSRHEFTDTSQAVVIDWCYGVYNHDRRHSSANMMSPVDYETTNAATLPEAA